MAVYLNDRFVDDEEALVHVSDLSMQRGYGVFDFLRAANGKPLFIEDHLERFFFSAQAMHLSISHSKSTLQAIIAELLLKSGLAEAGIRIMLTGGYSPNSYEIAKPNLVITCKPVKLATEADFERGLKIITKEYQRELPGIKSINYQMAVWLQPMLREKGAEDVLYFNKDSFTEFPRSNVFVVDKNGTIITPKRNILKGITRKKILENFSTRFKVEERDINYEELITASEVFATSTTKRIIPIVEINGQGIGNKKAGKITEEVYNSFQKLVNSYIGLL